MVVFSSIAVRQPRPHDIVDNPVGVCGVGTGFEGVISARVRDNNSRELRELSIRAGGTLSSIAERFLGDADLIFPGQVLRVPQ